MIVYSIAAKNYGPFGTLQEMRLGPLATIIGQNDVGKSNILRALQVFFDKRKIEESDVHKRADSTDNVMIEVAFSALPERIELEDGVQTGFPDEMLVDSDGLLRIRKTYPRGNLTKVNITLINQDFEDEGFAGLPALKERDLNARCESVGIEVTRAGRGITNKSKRDALRAKARDERVVIMERELPLTTKDDLWKKIDLLLPEFILFETDTKLGVGETTFQSQFRAIIKTAAEQPEVVHARDDFTGGMRKALQSEVDKILVRLRHYTDALTDLTVKPNFSWDKAVTFDILGKDEYGIEESLDRRGSGMRRLMMVAFFQYLAERGHNGNADFVFAIEEPENCLHPGLQRELVASFRHLANEGYQVIVTSHSPVFAGASPIEDLALVVREAGAAKAIQKPALNLSDVAEQLGVEPSDQITSYHACVFVEGPTDIKFWRIIASKLKEGGHVHADFGDKQIGLVLCGGNTMKYWIDSRAMRRLNRRFGAVVDSDRKSRHDNIPGRKLKWKDECENQGGRFFILRKREIENYLHSRAIARSDRSPKAYDDFTDMKELFGENIYKLVDDMSCEEILEMDRYEENGAEHHELKEIVETFLALTDPRRER